MMSGRFWKALNSTLVFAFVALLMVVDWGYAVVPLLAAGTCLVGLALAQHGFQHQRLDRDDGWFCLTLLAYGGFWLLDVGRTGNWPVGEGNQGLFLPLWPVLATVLLIWLRGHPPNPRALWWAVGCGALAMGGIALYERLVLGQARADNDMNAIPFGNLSLLLGILSLLAALWCLRHGSARRWSLLVLVLLAAVAGLLGSVLSGTRGGWVAVPLLLLLVYRTSQGMVPARVRSGIAAGVLALVLAVILVPQTGVVDRIGLAVSNLQDYWLHESRGTSVGLRLEMWRAGGMLFLEEPLLGWGEGRLELARDKLVAQGLLHPGIQDYDQLHSDLIDTTTRRGLVGLGTLLMLYFVPMWLFWRRMVVPDASPELRILAATGMIVPIAFIDFGLTQSMLRDVRGLSSYLGLCVVCWALLRHSESRQTHGGHGHLTTP